LGYADDFIKWAQPLIGHYPETSTGGIAVDYRLGFALETQSRPIYSKAFFPSGQSPSALSGVVAHELTHQWYGDTVALHRWTDIWLNEGFATYVEWHWEAKQAQVPWQRYVDFYYHLRPAGSPWWNLHIGDPGPAHLFDFQVYARGALTLEAIHDRIGARFWPMMRQWASTNRDGNVTTAQFVHFVNGYSTTPLTHLIHRWLYESGRPPPP
jgi:aminopeptidase N